MSYWDGTKWVADAPPVPKPASRTKRIAAATLEASLVVALTFGLIAGSVFAAKGGNGDRGKTAGGTIALVVLDGGDSVANHGERVAFDVSTTATDRPFVGVRCWQGPDWVLDAYTGYFETYMFDPWVTLDSPYWTVGVDATCTARLFYYDKRGNQKVLATLDFPALA